MVFSFGICENWFNPSKPISNAVSIFISPSTFGATATDPFPALHCLRSTPCAPRRRRLESLPVSDHRSLPSPPALHCLRSTPYAPRRRRRLESPLRPVSATRIPIVFESPSHFNRVNRQVSADFQLLLDSVASSSINHNQLQRRTAMADILASLRSLMASHTPPLDALVVPSEDYHQSEYVSARDKRRAFVSGFTGSAGFKYGEVANFGTPKWLSVAKEVSGVNKNKSHTQTTHVARAI
ncbi:hypothetical protein LXL04_036829 [Taraxacum kok-saghyz]